MNILTQAVVRTTLKRLAESLSGGGVEQPTSVIVALIKELELLRRADPSSKVWLQAVSGFTGVEKYYLESVNLLPESD